MLVIYKINTNRSSNTNIFVTYTIIILEAQQLQSFLLVIYIFIVELWKTKEISLKSKREQWK